MVTLYNLQFFCLINFVFSNQLIDSNISDRNKREINRKTILDEPRCSELKTVCNNLSENNDLLILECLQSLNPSRLSILNTDCQHTVWNHTRALIQNNRVKEILTRYCSDNLDRYNCRVDSPEGDYLKCIVSNKEQLENSACNNILVRLENVAFQDYRWISNFLQHCSADIERLHCGRIDSLSLGQSKTITCLQNNILNIDDRCKMEVFKLSEIQADNIKLDRQLYLACVEDHRRYCQQFPGGSARVFTCLLEQIERLTTQCQNQLLRRQKLIAQDYRVSKGLMRACKDDIKKTHCRRQTSNDKTIRLAQILLCLENVVKNGTKLDPDCENEIIEHRKILMQDFRLSPELAEDCKEEIVKYCSGVDTGGKTLHCLMDHARLKNVKKRIGEVCQRALESLVKETDVGEDWRVDPVLHQACYPVVKAACRDIRGGDARVMSCLLDNIGADHMTDECEDALIQIQYFVARDFKLDPQLYRSCRDDAVNFCHATRSWEDNEQQQQPSYGPQVLSCLYRYAYNPDEKMQITKNCLQQIQRVMRQRAISVDLQPEIEEVCLNDLALFCFDKTKKGEETLCLQKNLEELNSDCKKSVITFTEAEAEHAELNPYINAHCRKEMETLCNIELKNDEGDLMECLIAHKNDVVIKTNPVCRASIEHFQIISLKDYRFTYKFKLACKHVAMRFCTAAKSKTDVITCLSEKVTNDTVKGVKSDVPKDCRQQLKAQLFQQRENIDLNPNLNQACSTDIKKYCNNIKHGNAQVLECLQNIREKLTDRCAKEVFKIKKQESFDNSVDYTLMTMCADTIEQFCSNHERSTILDCLKRNKDERGFQKKCRNIVIHRMIEQNTNYQLNPSLQENCKMDINKFCLTQLKITNKQHDLNDVIIKCLKNSFRKSNLSHRCEMEIVNILREQALDVNLNPLIRIVCKNELDTICRIDDTDGDTTGRTEECLKNAFLEKRIPTKACQIEVASMIEESEVDIQIDPLLQQTCALDILKFCNHIPQGNGRHIQCLRISMEKEQLTPDCKNMLSKRLKMYENAAQVAAPEDFHQLYRQVVTSPAKYYFFLMFLMMSSTLFVVGILFGRAFRRHVAIKNK